MIDFLWSIISGPVWFNVVLIFIAGVTLLAYGIRSLTAPSAWVMLALFYIWIAASNSWHFVPQPNIDQFDRPDVYAEAWRMWAVYLYETLIGAYLIAGALTAGVSAWIAWGVYTGRVRITMLTVFYAMVIFVGQVGEALQRYVCKTNDLWIGREHLYRVYGGNREACGRVFEAFGLPEAVGPLLFPFLTVLILPIIMWRVKSKLL